MRIEHYSFGKITIGTHTFTSDVIIYPERIASPWWRREGHFLHMEDLKEVLEGKPEAVVIGTGFFGAMAVPEDVVETLRSEGLDVYVARTTKAAALFNDVSAHKKTIACLHLTC